ncbi:MULTISPECIES: carboxylesterase family protein [Chryseobacterium]|uniref:Para-nitrobenzyl esterase n=1 Tax=Chryseobacterium taihuense TaxID=1141221 RepID=A0A4V6IDU8_9FLAO|nr:MULTISPECIES: carboxylesterase family protein [Chryseobacterium]QQV01912.1 carboxylesterase family protein [Chryseobacterium sp. FDAARGOS 1104]VFB04864.1 Para-nitrobenzyl esterase [Chryseobacterium taihuense]
MNIQNQTKTHTFHTSFGNITAFHENGVLKIKNIRYAHSERFKLPTGLKENDSEQILDKTPVCPQKLSPFLDRLIQKTNPEDFIPYESPQFLTITRPEISETHEKLPVIVWIHGGSYEVGCGSLPTSDPSVWVEEQKVIVVSVSYRLGLFGFLGGTDERPANLGLFDMIEALKWIQNHIENFEGDKNNITLFGQSSGGDAIAHLMISEGVEGLFHRAIIQSAPLGFRHKRQKMSEEFFLKTGELKNENDVIKMVNSYEKFLPSFRKFGLKTSMPFCTQYGFPPLCKEEESLSLWRKNASKYDVLIGSNHDETAFYVKTAERGLYTYLPERILNSIVRSTTQSIYEKPAQIFAENYADGGGNIHLYKISSLSAESYTGASHCIDLPLIFASKTAWKNSALLKNISWEYLFQEGRKIRALWADFARTGQIKDVLHKSEILKIKKINNADSR